MTFRFAEGAAYGATLPYLIHNIRELILRSISVTLTNIGPRFAETSLIHLLTLPDSSSDRSRRHFRFTLHEYRRSLSSIDIMVARQIIWERVLRTRGKQGLNRNTRWA